MPNLDIINTELKHKLQILLTNLATLDSVIVAFSGGVDSSVLARAAVEAKGGKSMALCAVSPSMPEREPERIANLAREIGIELHFVHTDELTIQDYRKNPKNRCYFCKKHILQRLLDVAKEKNFAVLVEGSNADDSLDFRPGAQAVQELNVVSPLAEAGFTKKDIRELARFWGLSVAERPSSPCLSSRIAYGVEITEQRLRQIDKAERWLTELGVSPLRVRLFPNDVAVIETSAEWIAKLAQDGMRDQIVEYFQSLGFLRTLLSMTEFRSGSMNVGINGRR
ncbi:MAG: ATP-dependent sacrificial sulfur transferase LarE [Thermoguttaceae bacterium]|nr:ATP-dependent sacrificial sulfur transferase LarE [Thermoguttaceae bacterium]